MEKDAEELQLLGPFGIIREACNILRSSCTKLLGQLTLSLLLPLSFAVLSHTLVSQPLLRKIGWNGVIFNYQMEFGSYTSESTLWELTSGSRDLIVFVAVVTIFIYVFRMLSTATVVYTVASIYTAEAKNLSYARVIRIVPRVWNRLVITYLWDFIIFLAFYNASGLALFLLTFFCRETGYKLNSEGFVCSSILITLIFLCADVYISTVWNLASVVSVLEDKYHGLGTMWKSKNLMKGKLMTALALAIFYFIFTRGFGEFFWYAVVNGRDNGMGIAARAVYAILLVGLLCFVNLMGLLTQSVLYFVCTSYHLLEKIENKHLEIHDMGYYMTLP